MYGGLRPRMYWNSLTPLLVHCTLYSWFSVTVWLHLSTTVSPSLAYLGTMADSSNRSLQSENNSRRNYYLRCSFAFVKYACIIIIIMTKTIISHSYTCRPRQGVWRKSAHNIRWLSESIWPCTQGDSLWNVLKHFDLSPKTDALNKGEHFTQRNRGNVTS